MTQRVRSILEIRWEKAGEPLEGWVWVAPTKSGHMESSSLKRQHKQVFDVLAVQAQKNNQKPFRKFVLYSLRHTFLTRLGESGCDAWTLARIAGHSDIRISARYVHPSEDAVLIAMTRLGGHKIGHNENPAGSATESTEAANSMIEKEKYGGRDRVRTCDPLLAKQVLSQLSYTPTVGTIIHFKAFTAVRKLRNHPYYPLLCHNCVKTPLARTLLCQNFRHFVGSAIDVAHVSPSIRGSSFANTS